MDEILTSPSKVHMREGEGERERESERERERERELNISQQGKGGDIFSSIGKINAFKLKVKKWKSNVEKMCFSDFELFD